MAHPPESDTPDHENVVVFVIDVSSIQVGAITLSLVLLLRMYLINLAFGVGIPI